MEIFQLLIINNGLSLQRQINVNNLYKLDS